MRIGVCDDQREARELAAEKIKCYVPECQIIKYTSGEEVLAEKDFPDILLLDIQMQGLSGMETARRLRERGSRCSIIFVTAIEDCVFEAFDVEAFHYLLKPFTDDKLGEVLQKAIRNQEDRMVLEEQKEKKKSQCIIINVGGEHMTVRLQDIVYAEVFNRKITLHMLEGDIEYYGKMKDLEAKTGDGFYRTHRAFLVNFKYVRKYDASFVTMEKGRALIAKQNYREFVKRYLRYNSRGD